MILKYKFCSSNNAIFGLGPVNSYSLRVFLRKAGNSLTFFPKKISNATYEHVFGKSHIVDLSQDEREGLGALCKTIRDYEYWNPKSYQGEESDVIISDVNRVFTKIAKNHAKKFHIRGEKDGKHTKKTCHTG